jgi:hypothetical protein
MRELYKIPDLVMISKGTAKQEMRELYKIPDLVMDIKRKRLDWFGECI